MIQLNTGSVRGRGNWCSLFWAVRWPSVSHIIYIYIYLYFAKSPAGIDHARFAVNIRLPRRSNITCSNLSIFLLHFVSFCPIYVDVCHLPVNLKAYCVGHQAWDLPHWVKWKFEAGLQLVGGGRCHECCSQKFCGKPLFLCNPALVIYHCYIYLWQSVLLGTILWQSVVIYSVLNPLSLPCPLSYFPAFPLTLFDKTQRAWTWWISKVNVGFHPVWLFYISEK